MFLGSISAVLSGPVCVPPRKECFRRGGGGGGGARAHLPKQRLVIEPTLFRAREKNEHFTLFTELKTDHLFLFMTREKLDFLTFEAARLIAVALRVASGADKL